MIADPTVVRRILPLGVMESVEIRRECPTIHPVDIQPFTRIHMFMFVWQKSGNECTRKMTGIK